MTQPRHLHPADLQGVARLCAGGVTATADLVEHVHHAVTRVPGVQKVSAEPRTRGITGLVYRSIHCVTGLVGGTLDLAFGLASRVADAGESSTERDRALAALNGVLGDHLQATGNPLAIGMALRRAGTAFDIDRDAPNETGRRLAILLHGLCMNERCWSPPTDDDGSHGLAAALADGGWTALELRYNSGRAIHDNGRELDGLLDRLVAAWGQPIREIVLVGHSMGGLVARAAAHVAAESGSDWSRRPLRLVSLGTPHHGSPLERVGHGLDRLLGISRYTVPFTRLGRMRSAGIMDLRHGSVLPRNGSDSVGSPRTPRLPEHAVCYAVAATLDGDADSLRSRFVGDGLVPVPSALGAHDDPGHRLPVEPDHRLVIPECGHVELLRNPDAVQRVRAWLR
jgi:pimeloyl-ACP methyl ester carboxylesterase